MGARQTMPEGPEIKLCADRIKRAVLNQDIQDVYFAFEHLKVYEDQLRESQVKEVLSRGKALLIFFQNNLVVYSHNQLYGKWYIKKDRNIPQTNRSLRFAIYTKKKSALLYSASDIEVMRPSQLAKHPFVGKIGPDVLDQQTKSEDILNRLIARAHSGRQLGSLLLDQHFLAGLGNYLRCEILFLAGLNPKIKPKQLDHEKLEELAHLILEVSRQSYKTKGITNDLKRVALLKEQGKTRSQYRHHVFARANKPCYRCGNLISKTAQASRPFFFCKCCQPGSQ